MPASSDDGRPPRRNAHSLDLDCSPTMAAAWVWHLHASQPEVTTEGRFVSHNRRRSSGACNRKDSRFRLEAEAAAAAATPLPAAGKPSPLQAENLWDCGSKLYDTFELVSFSNRLDRSLLGVPEFQTPKSLHHAHSPLHQPGGILRTLSLPRSMSLHRIKGSTPLNGPFTPSLAVNDSVASPDRNDVRQSSISAQKAPNRSFSAKCSVAKLGKIFKKVVILRKRMRCIGRKEPISPKQQQSHRSGGQLKQLKQCLAVEEKHPHQHFHHHYHHHHYHYLHHLAGCHQSKEAGRKDYKPSVNSQDPWSPRAESARLSSETMSKICADKNWL